MENINFTNISQANFQPKSSPKGQKPQKTSKENSQEELRAGADYAQMQKAIIKMGKIQAKSPSKSSFDDMKPSELRQILAKRNDLDEDTKSRVKNIYDLLYYDTIKDILKKKGYTQEEQAEELKYLIGYESDSKARLETVPALIEEGYDPKMVLRLNIKEHNKDFVGYVLKRQDLISKAASGEIENQIEIYRRNYTQFDRLSPEAIEAKLDKARKDMEQDSYYTESALGRILTQIDSDNVKYLEECINTTGSPDFLSYWDENSKEIYTKFLKGIKNHGAVLTAFDRIRRRHHTKESMAQIVKDGALNEDSEKLLEFKKYDTFKNINTSNFNTLSVSDRKEFLNAFISAVDPKEILYDDNFETKYRHLAQRMKIFEEIYSTDSKETIKNYQDVIRKMLHQIPESDFAPIKTPVDYGNFMQEYRLKHPHPAMTDDLSRFDTRFETLNGKTYKVIKIKEDSDIKIATHRMPTGESILNVEALEITDEKMLLCIGLKSGNRKLNYDPKSYALAVKPRLGNDWWVQSYGDVDSGNGAEKNVFNVGNYCLKTTPSDRTVKYIPELIKKEMDLSANEYQRRMAPVKNCTTLDEIKEIDPELELAIRKVLNENECYEGLLRPEVMGVCIPNNTPLEDVCPDVLEYCEKRNVPVIEVELKPKKPKKPRENKSFTIGIN